MRTGMRQVIIGNRRWGELRVSVGEYLRSPAHYRAAMFIILMQLIVMCMYGAFEDAAPLDALSLFLFILLLLEIVARICSTGFYYYWWQPNDHFSQMANRFDLLLSAGPALLLVVLWSSQPCVVKPRRRDERT